MEIILDREVAWRIFAHEFNRSSLHFSESDERAPNYIITPTGVKCNRLFIVGVVTEVENINAANNLWRARIADPTGVFTVYAGQYQPEAAIFLSELKVPAYVAVVGKARKYEPENGSVYTSVRPEEINNADEKLRDRWVMDTAERTLERIRIIEDALKSGLSGNILKEHLLKKGTNVMLADGAVRAIVHYKNMDRIITELKDSLIHAIEIVSPDCVQIAKEIKKTGVIGEAIQEEAIPEKVIPKKDIQEEAVPEEAILEKVIPEEAISEKVIPEEAISEKVIPEEAISEKVIPKKDIPKEAISKDTILKKDIPDKAIQEAIQEEAIQEEAISEEAIQEAIQEEAIQEEAISEKVIPKKDIPEEAIQEEAIPEKKNTQEPGIKEPVIEKEPKEILADIIDNLDTGKGISYSRVTEAAISAGIDAELVEASIKELMAEGRCYEPKIGMLRKV